MNDGYVSVISEGRGEDLLFLHGYMSSKESFYYQLKFFSQYYKVTAPDILGFGKSSPLPRAYSVEDYSVWLDGFIKKSKLNRPRIIAHSFGARVALKYLAERPNACSQLVITGGAGIVKPRSPQYIRRVKAYRRIKKIFPRFAEKHFGSAEYRALSPLMKESYKKIVNEDLSGCAEKIRCPALLVYGRDDTVTPACEEGETFNRLIKASRLTLCDGGHFCFSEHPDCFNKTVFAFFCGQ